MIIDNRENLAATHRNSDAGTRKKRTPSAKQVEASQRNGSKSKGPRTPEGKAVSRINALKHGMFAEALPVVERPFTGSRQEFIELTQGLLEDFEPRSQIETSLVESLAMDLSRLKYVQALEARLWTDHAPSRNETDRIDIIMRQECRGTTVEQLQAERDLFQRCYSNLACGKALRLKGRELEAVVGKILAGFRYIEEELDRTRQDIKELDAFGPDQTTNDPAKRMSTSGFSREKLVKRLSDLREHQAGNGTHSLGCETEAELRGCLSGKRPIHQDCLDAWKRQFAGFVSGLDTKLSRIQKWQKQQDRLVRQQHEAILADLPKRQHLQRLESMARRNIERTLRQLQLLRGMALPGAQVRSAKNGSLAMR